MTFLYDLICLGGSLLLLTHTLSTPVNDHLDAFVDPLKDEHNENCKVDTYDVADHEDEVLAKLVPQFGLRNVVSHQEQELNREKDDNLVHDLDAIV